MAISRISAVAAKASSVTLGTHAAGDLLIGFAYNTANGIPTLPAGWTAWPGTFTITGNSNAGTWGYKYAASSSDTSGSWAGSDGVLVHVYRDSNGTITPGAVAAQSNVSAATILYPALTMTSLVNGNWAVRFGANESGTNHLTNPPSTTPNTAVTGVADTFRSADSNGPQTSNPTAGSQSVSGSGGSSGITLEIKAAAIPPTGTVAATQLKPTATASGTEDISGTVAATQPKPTSSATGTYTDPSATGTVAASQLKPSASASGTEAFTAAAAATQPVPTASATGAEVFAGDATGTQPKPTASAAGAEAFAGTVAATPPKPTATASGTEDISGTVAATQPKATASASGIMAIPVSGSVDATQPKPAASATGGMAPEGSVAATQLKPTATASGAEAMSGSATGTQPKPIASAAGSAIGGPVAATQPKPTASATGSAIGGPVAVTQPKPTASAGGGEDIPGTVTASQPKPTASATSIVHPAGSVAATGRKPTASVNGSAAFTGIAHATQAKPTASATGERTIPDAGDLVSPVLLLNPMGMDITLLMPLVMKGTIAALGDVINIPYVNQPGLNNVVDGCELLNNWLMANYIPGRKIYVFGYSEGCQVASMWLELYGPTSGISPADLEFILVAHACSKYGGFAYEQEAFDTVAYIHGVPEDTEYPVTIFTRQYDGVSDFPNDDEITDAISLLSPIPDTTLYSSAFDTLLTLLSTPNKLLAIENAIAGLFYHIDYFNVAINDSRNVEHVEDKIRYVWSPSSPPIGFGQAEIETAFDRIVPLPIYIPGGGWTPTPEPTTEAVTGWWVEV